MPGLIPGASAVAKWFVEEDEPGEMHGIRKEASSTIPIPVSASPRYRV